MSQESQNSGSTKDADRARQVIQDQCLKKMEAIMAQAALGIHVLFDNQAIAIALKDITDDKDFYDFDKMKLVQDSMTELISKRSYFEKLAYIQSLDKKSLQMVIRAYFHIIENNVLNLNQKH